MSGEQKINSIRSTKDGVETSVSMEEIENGFIITVYKNWQDKKGGYNSETKKYFKTFFSVFSHFNVFSKIQEYILTS